MEFLSKYCWLIPLLVGLICAILGYLLGRLSGGSNTEDHSEELERLRRRNAQLETDLAACRKAKIDISKPAAPVAMASGFAAGAATTTTAQTQGVVYDKAAARAAMGKSIKEDDLTVVEGIGPKIRELFHNFDIKTWAALADTSVEKCQEVLNSGGKRFEIHRPATWPDQAKMAALGQWEALKKWQDEHDYGKK